MSGITIDPLKFKRNLSVLRSFITEPLFVILGKSSDVEVSNMNSAIFLYLFGYEFPETILVITEKDFICVTSTKKSVLLSPIKNDISILIRQKDNSNGRNIKEQLKIYGNTFCILEKETIKGEFSEFYMDGFYFVDGTEHFLRLFLYKKEEDVFRAKKSASSASNIVNKTLKLLENVHKNNPTHEEIQQKIDDFIEEEKDNDKLEFSYPPFLQSGNSVDTSELYFSNTTNTFISFDNLVLKLGLRYERINIEIGRTFLSNNEKILAKMNELYSLQEKIITFVNENKEIYRIKEFLREISSSLNNSDILFSTGLNLKEKLIEDLRDGMIIVINLEAYVEKRVIVLTDTFLLKNDELHFLTKKSEPFVIKNEKKVIGLRTKKREQDLEKNLRMMEHQKVLLDKLIEESINFYKNNTCEEKEEVLEKKIYIPYKKESLVPRKNKMFVDKKNEALIIPIFDFCVPFHISLVKNFTKTISDESGVIQINFKNEIKKYTNEKKNDQLKSVSYTAPTFYIEELANQITDLKRFFSQKEQCLNHDLVEQGELKEKTGRRVILNDCLIRTETRTAIKNKINNLELHENGFRFGDIQILTSNIKHIFFSEGSPEEKAILHFHLANPVMINNKKTQNIQFFKQISTKTAHDTSKINDEYTEFLLEQELEEKSKKINTEFKIFVKEIENSLSIKVEVPYKNKSFHGVPYKENVPIGVTQECIVYLTDPPYLVITLSELEIVNFERVILGLRTSDVVFVFKDKKKAPITIMSISADSIQDLKEFLDSKNVIFLETRVNIQWNNLLKTIMEDPLSFYENNAWYELLNPEMSEPSESSTDLEESEDEEDSEEESESTFAEEEESDSTFDEEEEEETEESDEYEYRKRRK